jgi:hypothetical protein
VKEMGRMVNLIPKGKVQKWLISYESLDEGGNVIEEMDSKEEVFMALLSLESEGTDMKTISVYPPNSNVTFEEFMAM